MAKNRIMLLEDERGIRLAVSAFLTTKGFEVCEAEKCAQAEEQLRKWRPNVVISDYVLPDGNALDMLPRLKAIDPNVMVVILTGHGSIELAVDAIKKGADQFLTKPVEMAALHVIVERLCEQGRARQRQMAAQSRESQTIVDPFVGQDPAILKLKEMVERVAGSDSPLLILGETGSGKSVLAKWIHEHGPRVEEAFVDVNCAGLSPDFLETELFGHQKGAFTSAVNSKMGLLEVAHRGTMFLDEIGDVDPRVQPKLLKVVEDKRFRRLGDTVDCSVDVRLIAATHRDLSERVRQNLFREDLYYRISAIPLRVPPLRERSGDIADLAAHILDGFAVRYGRPDLRLDPGALAALASYAWPGNIRELRNVLERAVLLTRGMLITSADLQFERRSRSADTVFNPLLTLDQVEEKYIVQMLAWADGQVDKAAEKLGISRSALYYKIKHYGIKLSKIQTVDPKIDKVI